MAKELIGTSMMTLKHSNDVNHHTKNMSATDLNRKAHIIRWRVILLQICALLGEQREWFNAL